MNLRCNFFGHEYLPLYENTVDSGIGQSEYLKCYRCDSEYRYRHNNFVLRVNEYQMHLDAWKRYNKKYELKVLKQQYNELREAVLGLLWYKGSEARRWNHKTLIFEIGKQIRYDLDGRNSKIPTEKIP